MTAAVFLPALLGIVGVLLKGWRFTFVFVALPILLLLPNYYVWKLAGIPSFSFHNYLLAILFMAMMLSRDRETARIGPNEILLILFVIWTIWSEWETRVFVEARNLLAVQLMGLVAPWMIGRCLAHRDGLLVGSLAMMTLLGSFIGWVSPYEYRMGSNPFDFWRSYWPGEVPWEGALYRAGGRRVAGPFAHPICQGFFFSMSIALLGWFASEVKIRGLRRRVVFTGHWVGLLLSISRGPILGTLMTLGITAMAWSRYRAILVIFAGVFGVVGGAFAYIEFEAYTNIDRGQARTVEQETAAYRRELLDNYLEVVDESPWFGYGRYQIPIVHGQKSVDNQYLFVALTHGLPAAWLFLLLMVVPAGMLAFQLIRLPHDHRLGRLGWALVALLVGAVVTQVTVFSGTQTVQVLAIFQGMSSGLADRLRQLKGVS